MDSEEYKRKFGKYATMTDKELGNEKAKLRENMTKRDIHKMDYVTQCVWLTIDKLGMARNPENALQISGILLSLTDFDKNYDNEATGLKKILEYHE